jgi:multidrug resistance efflux pump
MEKEKKKNYSENVLEILTDMPSWIIRNGIAVMLAILILLFIMSYFVKYPDIINSRIKITSEQPPYAVIANESGNITKLFIKNNDEVVKDQYLAIINNTANNVELLRLKSLLDTLEVKFEMDCINYNLIKLKQLGELQNAFENFYYELHDYKTFINKKYFEKKVDHIEEQLLVQKKLEKNLSKQKNLAIEEFLLAKRKFENEQKLFLKKLISDIEFDQSKKNYLDEKSLLSISENNLLNNQMKFIEQKKLLDEIKNDLFEKKQAYKNRTMQAYKNLKSLFEIFEYKYVLKAKISGFVSFLGLWSENQYLTIGETFLYVIPKINKIIGKIKLPIHGAGKVKVGQKVIIKLDQFQSHEFGVLTSRIEAISSIAYQNQYFLDLSFPNGLITTYGNKLELNSELDGNAEIITQEYRLLERLFYQLKSIFKNNI